MRPVHATRFTEVRVHVARQTARPRASCGITQELSIRGIKLVSDRLRDHVVLGLEVRVESAVGESGTGHDLRHADAIHTLALNRRGSLCEDSCPRSLLVVVVVPHRFPEVFTTDVSDNTTISQLWPGCRYTPVTFVGPTCVDMMCIIQPPHGSSAVLSR